MTQVLDVITYSSMVTDKTVYIAFAMAVLHNLEAKTADVLNAYVMTPNREMIWIVSGSEFGGQCW